MPHMFVVEWHTAPVPTIPRYGGKENISINDDDSEIARQRAVKRIARDMCLHPSLIVVTKVAKR